MKKKRNIYLAVFTLITVLCWIAFGVIATYRKTTVTPDITKVITPLNPGIDESVFQELEHRTQSASPNP